jgi:hypothetical protein
VCRAAAQVHGFDGVVAIWRAQVLEHFSERKGSACKVLSALTCGLA